MKGASDVKVQRAVRIELLRLRAATEREELRQLGCELLTQARPRHWLGHFMGGRIQPTLRGGRLLWGMHRRYELLLSSAWLLFSSWRGRDLRWPTLSLLLVRLLRFGLQRHENKMLKERKQLHKTHRSDNTFEANTAELKSTAGKTPSDKSLVQSVATKGKTTGN